MPAVTVTVAPDSLTMVLIVPAGATGKVRVIADAPVTTETSPADTVAEAVRPVVAVAICDNNAACAEVIALP
jgi:hypothetical protein